VLSFTGVVPISNVSQAARVDVLKNDVVLASEQVSLASPAPSESRGAYPTFPMFR